MKKPIVLALAAVAGLGAVQAQESPWLVRLRATHLDMANKNGTTVADLRVNDKTIPEVDVSYFFDKNVAAELMLTVPQKQTVFSGATALGTFKHLPPTLLLQYHFTDLEGYKPYLGAGVNYTRISSVDILNGGVTLDSHSWGGRTAGRRRHSAGQELVTQFRCEENLHPDRCVLGGQQHRRPQAQPSGSQHRHRLPLLTIWSHVTPRLRDVARGASMPSVRQS